MKPKRAGKTFEVSGKTFEIPIENLRVNPDNARDEKDYQESDPAMQDLMDDIKIRGIVTDLVVEKMDNDLYKIIFGHRRYHAAKYIGLKVLPCKISTFENAEEILYQQISENVVRKMPDPKSRGEQFDKLLKENPGMTAADLQRMTGAKDVAGCLRTYRSYIEGNKKTNGRLGEADKKAKEIRPDYEKISKAVFKRALVRPEEKASLLETACDENVTGHHVESVIQDLQKLAKNDIHPSKKQVREMVIKAKETDEHNIIIKKKDWDYIKDVWQSMPNDKPATLRHFFIDVCDFVVNEMKKNNNSLPKSR